MQAHNMLRGERIRLTGFTVEDAQSLSTIWDVADFLRHFDAVPAAPRSVTTFRERIEAANASANDFLFAIRGIDDGCLLGQLELDGILWPHGNAWISVAIFQAEDRGRGLAREALTLALDFAFYELNLHRITLTVFEYNTDAIALYERLGFVHEGTRREFLQRDGRRWDMLQYGLLRYEWDMRRQSA